MEKKFDEIVNHLITSGFVYPDSEIYGGLSNSWDYGPLGVELKNNIKKHYWQKFVQESPTNVGIDAAILMNPGVWKATGHVATFSDPLIDCKSCHARHRADNLIEEQFPDVDVHGMTQEQINEITAQYNAKLAEITEQMTEEQKQALTIYRFNKYITTKIKRQTKAFFKYIYF